MDSDNIQKNNNISESSPGADDDIFEVIDWDQVESTDLTEEEKFRILMSSGGGGSKSSTLGTGASST